MFPDRLANQFRDRSERNYMRHTCIGYRLEFTGSFDKPGANVARHGDGGASLQDEAVAAPRAAGIGGYGWRPCRWASPSWQPSWIPGGWGRRFTTALDALL